MSRVLALIGHGSRMPEGNQEVQALAERLRARAELPVTVGFIELARPTAAEALDAAVALVRGHRDLDGLTTSPPHPPLSGHLLPQGEGEESGFPLFPEGEGGPLRGTRPDEGEGQSTRQDLSGIEPVDEIVVLPAVLLAAAHAKNDVPLAVAEARLRHPGVRFFLARPLGVHGSMVEVMATRFQAAAPPAEPDRTAVLVVGHGSSDPDANADLAKLARLFAERRGLLAVDVAWSGVAVPNVESGIAGLLARRPKALVVLPYLLAPGRVLDKVRREVETLAPLHPRTAFAVAEPMGTHPLVEDLLLERAEEAVAGTGGMSCDACKYRIPLEGFRAELGGQTALRKSKAHLSLPTDAPAHSHVPPRKHVLVCVNRDCADRGSIGTLNALRARVREAGLDRQIRTTRAMCLGRCGEGPVVVVYPEGTWYRQVREDAADALFREHLQGDRALGSHLDFVLG